MSGPSIGAQSACEGWWRGASGERGCSCKGGLESAQKEREVPAPGNRGGSQQEVLDGLKQTAVSVKYETSHQIPGSCMSTIA